MDPLTVQPVRTTDAAAPEEPTSPVMMESVQVTAPPPSSAALRTANGDAVLTTGCAPNAAPASREAVPNRQMASDFLAVNMISNRFNCVSSSQFRTEKVKERGLIVVSDFVPWPAFRRVHKISFS